MTSPDRAHAAIVDGLLAARAAMADQRPDDAERILHDLHRVYGTTEVLAVALALAAGPAPAGGRP